MNISKRFELWIGIILGLGAIVGMSITFDHYFAHQSNHVVLCGEVKDLKAWIRVEKLQERIWAVEERWGCWGEEECKRIMPSDPRRQYLEYQAELKRLLSELGARK